MLRYLYNTLLVMKQPNHFSSALALVALNLTLSSFAIAIPQDLVETLGNEDYLQREDAEEKLTKWTKGKGKKTFKALEQLKEKAKSPEVKMRLNNVLDRMTIFCLLYTSPSPRDLSTSRMPSSA